MYPAWSPAAFTEGYGSLVGPVLWLQADALETLGLLK